MTGLAWVSALALLVAAPGRMLCTDGSAVLPEEGCGLHGGEKPSAARDAVAPAPRLEAEQSESPALGAPHAKAPQTKRHRTAARRQVCKDGTEQGKLGDKFACDGHGGIKE